MTLLRASCHCHPDTKQNLMWKYGESGNIWNTFRYTYPFVTILHTLSHTYSLFHSHTRSKSQHCYCSSKCYLEGLVFTKILYFQPRFRCCSLFFCSQENAKKSRWNTGTQREIVSGRYGLDYVDMICHFMLIKEECAFGRSKNIHTSSIYHTYEYSQTFLLYTFIRVLVEFM